MLLSNRGKESLERYSTLRESDLNGLLGYIRTWSGFRNLVDVRGEGAGEEILQKLTEE
jgi:hypothetical protein